MLQFFTKIFLVNYFCTKQHAKQKHLAFFVTKQLDTNDIHYLRICVKMDESRPGEQQSIKSARASVMRD